MQFETRRFVVSFSAVNKLHKQFAGNQERDFSPRNLIALNLIMLRGIKVR